MGGLADERGLVGRAGELDRLRAALGRASHGSRSVVVVGGEAGIGKTALVEAFVAEATRSGSPVLAGACLPVGDTLPYHPLTEALRSLVRSAEPGRLPALLGPRRVELARLLPELDPRGDRGAGDVEDDRSGQARLFEAVLGVVERVARGHAGGAGHISGAGPTGGPGRNGSTGVVLLVEDLHWADRSTLDLLAFLLRALRAAPTVVLFTVRSDELREHHDALAFLAECERDGAERLELSPLGRAEIGALVERRLGAAARAPGAELVEAVLERSGGNPFFAEQLLEVAAASAGEHGSEDRLAGGPDGRLRAGRGGVHHGVLSAGALPPVLREVLAARLAALPARTRQILRVASAGRRADDELIAAVTGDAPAAVADALRDAVARGVLVDAVGPHGGVGGYTFRHVLLREVAYAELLPGERARMHAAWGRALTERGQIAGLPVVPGEVAQHWLAARDHERALPALVEAGLAAEHVYAFAEARRHYEAALELWDQVPDADRVAGRDRVWVLQRAAETATLSGSPDRAVELGREAVTTLSRLPDPDALRLGELHGRLRWFLWEAGDREGAAAALQRALELLPESPASAARARALAQLAGLRLLRGDHRAAAEAAEQALRHARVAGAVGEGALALGVLGWARAAVGDVDAGVRLYREALAIAERLGSVEGIALGYANLAALLDRIGRTEAALAAAQDGFAIVSRLGLARTYGGSLLGDAAKSLFNLGRWGEAAVALEHGFSLGPVGAAEAWLHVNRARLRTNTGDFEGAAADLREVEAGSAAAGSDAGAGTPPRATAALAVKAELAVWQGDLVAVRDAARIGLREVDDALLPDPWLAWLAGLALRAEADAAAIARARRDEEALAGARTMASAVLARLEAFRAVATGPRDAAIEALCRAEAARLERRAGPRDWDAVAEAWDAVGRPYPVAYARFRAGEAVLGERGLRADAADRLTRAARIARDLGARPLLGEVEQLARQALLALAGDAPAEAADAGAAASGARNDAERLGLTSREAEVLALVAAGWSNQQIGDRLFITRKTASVHVSNILSKLGAANRVEAAAIARRLGIADELPPPVA